MSGVGKSVTDQAGTVLTTETGVGIEYDAIAFIPLSPQLWRTFYAIDLVIGGSDTLHASDLGYRTLPTDEGGVVVYPPNLETAFEIDRRVGLDMSSDTDTTATFGSILLNNLPTQYDSYTLTRNSDSRPVYVYVGQKSFDASRGVYVDPSRDALFPLFSGYSMSWRLSEEQLEIPLRDVTYFADRPLQTSLYTGTGGANGGPELTGKCIPVVRGGTHAYPVQNVPLVLVDAVNLIYQYTDAAGTVVHLYEGAAETFLYGGDVSNLWAGTPPAPGSYRTDNSHGLIQMGSKPVNTLTADVTGAFPVAGFKTTAALIALYLLSETFGQPSNKLDTTSFTSVDTVYPYTAGFYAGTEQVRGLDILKLLTTSLGARLLPNRNGSLRLFAIRRTPLGTLPSAVLSEVNIISVTPQPLSANLDPPPSVWKVGYATNYTIQSSGLEGDATITRTALVADSSRYSVWSDSSVAAAYASSNKPSPVTTALLAPYDAQGLADDFGVMWSGLPGQYAVEIPLDIAINLDIGSYVLLSWPLGNLVTGQVGQVVGEQIRSYDASATLTILVSSPQATHPFIIGVSTLNGGDTLG